MNIKNITFGEPQPIEKHHPLVYEIDGKPKLDTLIEKINTETWEKEFDVRLSDKIKNGEQENFIKQMIILTFKEKE